MLFAALAGAQDEERVLRLVDQLGARSSDRRAEAYAKLKAMGEKILPLLAKQDPADPEIRRQLKALASAYRKVRLILVARKARLALGEPVEMELRLLNETNQRYQLPLAHTPRLGATRSAFMLAAGGEPRPLPPDCIDARDAAQGKEIILNPGAVAVVRIHLEGDSSPLRRPGSIEIALVYHLVARRGEAEPLTESVSLELRSAPVRLEAYGRSPRELEAALGKDRRVRASALRELEIREDAAILPILRRHSDDPDLRLVAVKRLGDLAQPGDLDYLRAATRSPSGAVRKAAVSALGNYAEDPRARQRLLALADDSELQETAIRALRGHKHPAVIAKFIRLLPTAEGAELRAIQEILHDWTGIWVEGRLSEIRAFDRWWKTHRREWTLKNSQAR